MLQSFHLMNLLRGSELEYGKPEASEESVVMKKSKKKKTERKTRPDTRLPKSHAGGQGRY